MPNWVSNVVTVYHSNQVVISGLYDEASKTFSSIFQYIRPQTDTDAYIANWGTICDAWDVHVIQESANCLELHFQTASPPLEMFQYMQSIGFLVFARYWQNNNAFFGTWDDGESKETISQRALAYMIRT